MRRRSGIVSYNEMTTRAMRPFPNRPMTLAFIFGGRFRFVMFSFRPLNGCRHCSQTTVVTSSSNLGASRTLWILEIPSLRGQAMDSIGEGPARTRRAIPSIIHMMRTA